ncbi:class I SAM-dependent methyltransferase [Plantactinospora endophytica]|uniref:Class I SAM-dependent methyltransferase n=1 Tax=Plantactinospora endophytica TaxID=673535 RepID=A0ABQ4E0M7_9ACTN|nr:class I SAM-dependent methyltransferase [Plantactinospora endophytica]GIG88226.1 hypothetical protein Pen02_31620 [Plantactinospora endophytica]
MSPISTDRGYDPDAGVTAARIADQMAYLSGWLPPAPARILDAGCGRGDLARALARAGYTVTAVDVDPVTVGTAVARGAPAIVADLLHYQDDRPFDVVLCVLSLHHMTDLAGAVRRAWSLLRPGGLLVVDEFAWERADPATAGWYHDTAALLAAAGRLAPVPLDPPEAAPLATVEPRDRTAEPGDGTPEPRGGTARTASTTAEPGAAPDGTPYARWVGRHRDVHRLHPGDAVTREIARLFEIREAVRVPYLHRYLADRLGDDADGLAVFTVLRQIERLRVADGGLAAVGLRLLAQARPKGN